MMIKIDKKIRFLFLLGLIFFSNFVYAQELRVLEHIPAKEIESYLYDAIPMGVRWTPVLGGWNLAVSPNGKFIGFWSPKNLSVKVMDLETKEIIAELDDIDLKDLKNFTYTPIWNLTFSPDSRFLAIVLDKPSVVKLWDFKGPPVFSLKQTDVEKATTAEKKEKPQKVINLLLPDIDTEDLGAEKEPPQICFSQDGKYLATSVITKIYLWSRTNWQIVKTLKSPIPYGQERPGGARSITGLVFSPDSKYLVSRCGRHLSVWELYETRETEEYKKWSDEEMKRGMKKAAGGMTGGGSFAQKEIGEQMAETGKQMMEEPLKEPPRYETIYSPHLLLVDIGTTGRHSQLIFSHQLGKESDGNADRDILEKITKITQPSIPALPNIENLNLEQTNYFLISADGLRFEFNPGLWKSEMETAKALGLKPEEGFKAKVQDFASGPWGGRPVAVFGDLIAIGAPDDKREPAKIFRLSVLKELISFNTVKDKNTPDKTNLIFFFPDGKRLLTYNHLEGIYIFDISTLK